MTLRRHALATLLATGAFALAGCGMMDSKPMMAGNSMTVPLSAGNEVPPNYDPSRRYPHWHFEPHHV